MRSERAGRGDPVPCDSGLVMHDRNLATREAVEKGGFPDIRAAYDGDGGHGLEILNF
jgi:hypothetical protein